MKALSFPKNVRTPSGKTATLGEMKDYGVILQVFVRETETNLKSEQNIQRHNNAVDYLNHIAKHYNRELQLFNKEEQKRQMSLLYKVMQQSTS